MKQSCATCDAFSPNRQANPVSGQERQGWCRAAPPQMVQTTIPGGVNGPMPAIQGMWPPTNTGAWCRAWQPNEEHNG